MCRKHSLAHVFFLFLFTATTFAQSEKVDAIFAQWDKPDSPGCALGVIKDGQLIYQRGYGMANLEHNIPITADTVFYIASTSKQFTAMNIALLAQQGKISLDDDIRKLIPEFPRYEHIVTIRHLVHHTSGLRDFFMLMPMAGQLLEDIHSEQEVIELLARQKQLESTPGAKFAYNNSGYFLLGVIVRRVTGKSLRQFSEESFFAPLGMKSTHYHDNHTEIIKNRATGYVPHPQKKFAIFATNFELVGDGGVMTTITDIARWDQNFYTGKAGGMNTIHQALTAGKLNDGRPQDYAFGLFLRTYKGLKRVDHGGIYNGFRADLIRFPEQKFSVACLCNLYNIDVSKLAEKVADVYLADQFKASTDEAKKTAFIELSDAELKPYTGTYYDPLKGNTWAFSINDNKLTGKPMGASFLYAKFSPLTQKQFVSLAPAPAVEVEFNDRAAFIKAFGNEPTKFILAEAFVPMINQLREYAGNFFSEELQVNWQLEVKDDKLYLFYRNYAAKPLLPTVKDNFSGDNMNLIFIRDAQQKIIGFKVNSIVRDLSNLAFTRIGN